MKGLGGAVDAVLCQRARKRSRGDLAGMRPYYERALAICEDRLGTDHPTARTIRANLAALNTPPQTRE
jgi:hypothetical protein